MAVVGYKPVNVRYLHDIFHSLQRGRQAGIIFSSFTCRLHDRPMQVRHALGTDRCNGPPHHKGEQATLTAAIRKQDVAICANNFA
ncbi:hypothetical protein C0Q70_10589 [Pomacea canaliculata]|uniref:Uncharacterized protein n=1 Tax=Pomacea canaliculata TaxID=400727 RepID=A0A2T7P3L8_POMCA|nr:hypothetical protein C0Q70_10589 [Pomacea canaliculata]